MYLPSLAFSPDLLDDAVVDRDDRSVKARVDVDASAVGVRADHVGGVAGALALGGRAGQRRGVVDVVGVAGVGGDREVRALGEAGERADQGVGELAVLVGAEQDLVDVPVGVVVGEDRLADVLVAAGGPQVAGRGADRVDRVVRVLAAVVVGVDPVGGPGRGDELHPALGPGGGDVEVGPEGGLDLVDGGEHLPGDPVLGTAGLVDGEEEGRDLEGVDDEVGDADRGGAELRDGEARVGVGRGAVGVAEGGLLDLLPSRPWRRPWRPGPSWPACRTGRGSCRRRSSCRPCRPPWCRLPPAPLPPLVVVVLPVVGAAARAAGGGRAAARAAARWERCTRRCRGGRCSPGRRGRRGRRRRRRSGSAHGGQTPPSVGEFT